VVQEVVFKKLTIAIDASTTVEGGSQTHLVEVLRSISSKSLAHIDKIIVISNTATLDLIEDREHIIKYTNRYLNMNFIINKLWVNFFLTSVLKTHFADIVLDISGTYVGGFRPYVGMSRNMLLYEKAEVARFKSVYQTFRFYILRKMQLLSFEKSSGIIFISNYAKENILKLLMPGKNWVVIHHGISKKFQCENKSQYPAKDYHAKNRFKLLYVSNILGFKHQLNVVQAVIDLNKKGFHFELVLIGAPHDKKLTQEVVDLIDKEGEGHIEYLGKVHYAEINKNYHSADAFIFASTCENMPNTLIEAMTSGVPVICSKYGPMPEFGMDAVEYFDPVDVESLSSAILKVFGNASLRKEMVIKNKKVTDRYSWELCSDELFDFLKNCAIKHKN